MNMSAYQPPYTINPDILNRVAAISESIGRLTQKADSAPFIAFMLRMILDTVTNSTPEVTQAGLIEMTLPEKPRSSKQKYRLTDKGRQMMDQHGGG